MQPLLSALNLSTGYRKKQVLFDVSLEVMHGEIVLVTGGNGSGKSTLLKAIFGLLQAWNEDASVIFRPDPDGPAVGTHDPSQNLRIGLAYLPQKNAVFDELTVEDNLRLAGHALASAELFAARRQEVLEVLSPLRPQLSRKPETMSGGERQMLALGMTLLHRPKLLMLDEPLAGLDSSNAGVLISLISSLPRRYGCALVLVEHRQTELQKIGARRVHIRLGKIVPSA